MESFDGHIDFLQIGFNDIVKCQMQCPNSGAFELMLRLVNSSFGGGVENYFRDKR